VTKLARTAFLGMAEESSIGTYVAPTFSVPFTKASYETIQLPIRDESIRGNDAVLQGVYPGPSESTWDVETLGYTDIAGYWLRMIGTDTVVAATSTTLSSSSSINATSISTVASIASGSTIKIDTGANIEYATTGTPSGVGPYTIPIATPAAGLTKAHSSGVTVITTTKHTFAQVTATRPPSFSITVYDGIDYRGWTGCMMSELGIKIDPKAAITFNPKFVGYPEATQSSFSSSFSTVQPLLGWNWTMTDAGGSSTRGLTLDLTAKRASEAIHSSDGLQSPRETFSGALELDGSYKAIYEDSTTDMGLFLNWTQTPIVATLTKAIAYGGESIVITMSQGAVQKAVRDLSQKYVEATYDLSAIYNSTDAGITKVVLNNFTTSAY
jgi:hypothetical protein